MTSRTDRTADASDAFRELAGIDFSDHSIESVMTKVSELMKRAVPGAEEASVTFLENDSPKTVAFTGPLAIELDERQYARGYGPCLDGTAAGELVEIQDMATETRWPDWTRAAVEVGGRELPERPRALNRKLRVVAEALVASAAAGDGSIGS